MNKILVPNSVPTRPEQANSKKNSKKFRKIKKTPFRHYFYPKRDEIGSKSEKKILVPNSVPTRPRLENSKKKVKKFKKFKNIIPTLFLSKTG